MASSVSVTREYRVKWKVEKALSIHSVESDVFVLHQSRWRLYLAMSLCGSMKVSLKKMTPGKLTGRYVVQSFIVDHHRKPVDTQDFVLDDPDFTSKEIWRILRLAPEKRRDIFLPDAVLTFVIIFTPINPPGMDTTGGKEISIRTSLDMAKQACLENLGTVLMHLLDDHSHSDVTLKCGARSFPAHKIILSARSEVFAAIFLSLMAESHTGVIQISDMDATVLDQFLHYIYSGKLPELSVNNALALCVAADKYGMECLMNVCVKFIEENLARENACQILVFADVNGFKDLKDCVVRFIVRVELPRCKEIWLEFQKEHTELASEVLHHAYEEKCLTKRPRYNLQA